MPTQAVHLVQASLAAILVASGGMLGISAAVSSSSFLPHVADPVARPAADPGADLDRRLAADVAPLLVKYCVGCHSTDDPEANVDLEALRSTHIAQSGVLDLRLLREMIHGEQMPPKRKPQPTAAERRMLTEWLDAAIAYVPVDARIDPGWFTTHRLNRAEYANTLRDLLELDAAAAAGIATRLPADDTGYGFDNIADVLSTSPLAVEQYLDVAERAIEAALGPVVVFGDHAQVLRPLQGSTGRTLPRGGFFLYSNGAASGSYTAPVTGEYKVRIRAWETPAGEERSKLSLRLDKREIEDAAVSGTQAEPQDFEWSVRLRAGTHTIAAHFTNDYYVKDKADRNLAIESISVAGPLDEASAERPAAWKRVFEAGAGAATEEARAGAILRAFATRAYRRPASDEQVGSLMKVYRSQREGGVEFEPAVRTSLAAALVSPNFLFRVAARSEEGGADGVHRLDGYELASRLSYFLWSSMPDEALLRAAGDGSLLTDEGLTGQVRRMLADDRSWAFVENFSGQWLQLRGLDRVAIDRSLFPAYDDALRADMKAEATLFFGDVLRSDRSVLEFVHSRATFLNKRLASFYGVPEVKGDQLRRVELPEGSPRGGVLTMGAVLTLTSNPSRTSPVKRGLFVLDQILGAPPPPPPPEIPPLEQAVAENPAATVRERLAAHVSDTRCAACHKRLDPIGLTFEHFDPIGRWREVENGQPVDSSGTLPGNIPLGGIDDLKRHLLKNSDQVVEAITAKVLVYALGRGTEPFDRPSIRRIAARTRAHGDRFPALIESVVLSDSFRSFRSRKPTP